jgi:hypothetical protein
VIAPLENFPSNRKIAVEDLDIKPNKVSQE